MDLNFSEPISAAEWLNRQLSSREAKENFEGFSNQLASSLQLHFYRTQQALDEMAAQMPRLSSVITHELPQTQSALSYIVTDVQHLEANLQAHASASADVADRIRATETVKNRMELTYRALENQDNWEALIVNVKDVIANGDLDAIGGRLVALQKCFVSLKGAANFENRREQLEDVKNRVESVLIPRLIGALSSIEPWRAGSGGGVGHGSESLALKIISVFGIMERKDALKRVLNESRLKQMVKHWDEIAASLQEQTDGTDAANLDDCFTGFCDDLLASWHNQHRLFSATFPDPIAALLEHYCLIFAELRPKMEKQLENAWNKAQASDVVEDFLSMSLNIKHSQDVFCKSLEKHLDNHHNELCVKLWEEVKQMLRHCLRHYAEAESHLIFAEIARVHLDTKDKGKSSHTLGSAGSRIGNAIYASVVRCFQLTNGDCFGDIEEIGFSAIKKHCDKVNSYVKDLARQAGTQDVSQDSADGNYELLSDFVKALQHFGDLLVQLHNITESLPPNAPIHKPESHPRHFVKVTSVIKDSANGVFQDFYAIILQPVDKLLENVLSLPTWTTGLAKGGIEIPSFGLDPQEHITRIGNYLLTLPQALDPLLSSESASMKALKSVIGIPGLSANDESLSLAEIAIQGAMYLAMDKTVASVLKIRHLTGFGLRQLICDLKYIQNIAEDFAISPSSNFEALAVLLTIPLEEFEQISEKFPGSVVAFVSRARNVK